ncbi:YbaB/EbfC family nucleoid-associated protein [Streptomyces sp. NBC_00102]|uniref:YbaB/EbfC family nucleoid-associated protein n=1 Tax=Streptomyces sp. NBC_00102 TaxID=2975652 RepID=UPI0022558CF2|nr:YbaB/EbfC family nucleoid-associated protein [Streptomyces sp. NBC_00102]MCX5400450.1 YbaB/EbfC family nucleoid-associated protein [Streptomyces sp. NBC_00102]
MEDEILTRLAQAKAQMDATRAAVARAEQELRRTSVTVVSRDRAVEVTVGPQGEISGLQFLDGKYRTMGAPHLAASILEAAGEGRAQMARRVMDAFQPLEEPLPSLPEDLALVPGLEFDWKDVFGSMLDIGNTGAQDRSATAKLRDEIVEDGENG